jgi:ornithine cyclodeaminase/alanine dehydrogenase-like protein (mu-crystallin family)
LGTVVHPTAVPQLPIFSREAVFAAVDAPAAIERVRDAFVRHRRGEWVMPSKVYLDSPPYGDFRAMPARGGDLAMLKWISSFPDNPGRGLPTVIGLLVVSDATTSEPLALLDAGAVTALRTGAVAAVAAEALAGGRQSAPGGPRSSSERRPDAGKGTPSLIGAGVNGAWAARCLAAAGFGPGVAHDANGDAAQVLADELGWSAGSRADALACDVVTCVTPGHRIVVDAGDLRPGMHLNMLGADGPGKAEASVGAVASCALFCDEWDQASHGGELTGAVEAGLVVRERVTDLGAVLTGEAPGRPGPESVTLFDSTGLAIQDLAIAAAVLDAHRDGRVDVPAATL